MVRQAAAVDAGTQLDEEAPRGVSVQSGRFICLTAKVGRSLTNEKGVCRAERQTPR